MKNTRNVLKKILVATDFSAQSQFAISRAVELAKTTKAQLILLHVAKKEFVDKAIERVVPIVSKVLLTPEEHAAPLLKKQMQKLSKNKITIKYSLMVGDNTGPQILKYAKVHKVDLLVIGSHGKYSLRDWFVGTTAEYIAKKTPIPVLIVKKSVQKPYQKVLLPIDFSVASKDSLKFATQLFSKADFRLLHVGDYDYDELLKEKSIQKEKLKKMEKAIFFLLKEKSIKFVKECNDQLSKFPCDIKLGYPGNVILDEAKKRRQDLVMMGTQGRGHRRYLFIGRVASRVLIEIDRDILLVPPKKKK